MAATAAVVGISVDVDLAAVGGNAVAILERRVARADSAHAGRASSRRIGYIASEGARAAVVGIGADVDLAAVGGDAIAILERRVATAETARATSACREAIGRRWTD